MLTFALASQVIGLSGASGTRAGGSLLLLALAAHYHYLSLPPELMWLATPQALGAFVAVSTLSVRQWLHTRVDQLETEVLHPRRWLLRTEDVFGLGLAAVAILWAPLSLALVLLFTLACGAAGLV